MVSSASASYLGVSTEYLDLGIALVQKTTKNSGGRRFDRNLGSGSFFEGEVAVAALRISEKKMCAADCSAWQCGVNP